MTVTLTAWTRQAPEPGTRDHTGLPTNEITATADTYDAAMEALRIQLPAGWQLLSVRRIEG